MRARIGVLGFALLATSCHLAPGAMVGEDGGDWQSSSGTLEPVSGTAVHIGNCDSLFVSNTAENSSCAGPILAQLEIDKATEDGKLRVVFKKDEMGAYPLLVEFTYLEGNDIDDPSHGKAIQLTCSEPVQVGDNRESNCGFPAGVSSSFQPEEGMTLGRFSRLKLKHPICQNELTAQLTRTTCPAMDPIPEGFAPPRLFLKEKPVP